jgi:DNA uptake protein ComE-like DNA-binding protein
MSARRPEAKREEAMGYTTRGVGWEWKQSWFMLVCFLTFFLYWLPLVFMGLRTLQFRWMIYGLFYTAPVIVLGLVLAAGGAGPDGMRFSAHTIERLWQACGGFWIVCGIHTWNALEEYLVRVSEQQFEREDLQERMRSRIDAASEGGAERGERGERGERAERAPRRLLNVNRVTETELAMLPGLGTERARQALRLREDMGEYRSFADFANKLQLPAEARARLRPLFEPDSEEVLLVLPKDDPSFRVLPDGNRVMEVNWASAEALGALPGLGPEVARRAVALRDGDGPFKSLEDFRYRLGLPMDVMIKISPFVSVISMSTRPGGGSATRTGGRIVDV